MVTSCVQRFLSCLFFKKYPNDASQAGLQLSIFLHLSGFGISGVYHYIWVKGAPFEQCHLLSLGSW